MLEADALLSELDLTLAHAVVTALCAIMALIKMQCLTALAGFSSSEARKHLFARLALALLSIGLALNSYYLIVDDISPWWPDTACRVLLLFVLMTVPAALPRHLRHHVRA